MERREFVTGTGLVLAASIAGCLGNEDGSPENESENSTDTESDQNPDRDENNSEEPLQSDETRPSISEDPRDILLKNYHNQSHTIDIQVNVDNESVHDGEYELEEGSSDNIKRISDIVNETGTYSITATISKNKTEELEWDATNNSSNVAVYITEDEELDIRPDQSM
ncbi:hypothetical protein [Halopiger xanaduensis]|nr:hypothetical protein [Halopiger xanaduensis]